MLSLAVLIDKVIDIYTWIVIASAIMSWLVSFGVVNVRNQFIRVVVSSALATVGPTPIASRAPTSTSPSSKSGWSKVKRGQPLV